MLIGYARVSTQEQSLAMQRQALKEAGCERIFDDTISGVLPDRLGFAALLDIVRPGDVVMVWKLDRLGRKPIVTLNLIEEIERRGAVFRSLTEPQFNTDGPLGRFMLQIFAGVAELERGMIRERCAEGRKAAKQRGVKFGRKPLLDADQVATIRLEVSSGRWTQIQAARRFRVSPQTVSRLMKAGSECETTV